LIISQKQHRFILTMVKKIVGIQRKKSNKYKIIETFLIGQYGIIRNLFFSKQIRAVI
jgi:hypothetical protein